MASRWTGTEREVEGVRKAARNVGKREQLARYIYERVSAYVGPDHEEVAVNLIFAALNALSPPEPDATEDPWETIRQQMRELGREVWVECLAAEGYAPTDRTPWAIPLSDMVRRHMDRLRSSVQPRRVMSRERLQEVFYWWADHPGDPPWEEVATRLGIDLTPKEDPDD